jgi:hypothetical protein
MPMICPDCQETLDGVPLDDPCPKCGGLRRSAVVSGTSALISTSAIAGAVTIGYSLAPGWTYQWRSIQHHLTRLREQYQGIRPLGNLEAEETVHAVFLDLYHFYDWPHQDRALATLDEPTVRDFIDQHQTRSAYAGTTPTHANT